VRRNGRLRRTGEPARGVARRGAGRPRDTWHDPA